jgi:hypothetical protein
VATRGGFHLVTQAAELADLLLELGRSSEAEEWCAVAEQHARTDDLQGQVSVRLPRARLLASAGELDAAEGVARDAVGLAEGTDELNLRASTHLALADILEWADRLEEAAEEVAAAAALYGEKGNAAAADRLGRRAAATAPSPSAS